MSRRGEGRDVGLRAEVRSATAEIADILTAIDDDRRALMRRVTGRAVSGHPAATVAGALGSIQDAVVRGKVVAAWRRLGQRRDFALISAVDRAVTARRQHAASEGYDTVLGQTFARCGVDSTKVESFLVDNLSRAIRRRKTLERQLTEVSGATEAPLLHLARAAAIVRGDVPRPRLPLKGCVMAIVALAERVFGIELGGPRISGDGPFTLPVRIGANVLGMIQIDLVPSSPEVHQTVEDGNTVRVSKIHRRAHVLALVERGEQGPVLTFDAARSLFHEVGHALDHVLIPEPWPTRSGLDTQKLEHFEEMSTWWELLAFHPELGQIVGLDPNVADGLDRARGLRVLETQSLDLARAWGALVDLRLHKSGHQGLADVQAELLSGQEDFDAPDLGTLAGYLVAMVFRQHPGAGFLYPWAAARAAELADDVVGVTWEAMAPTPGTQALLLARTKPSTTSPLPSAAALDTLPESIGL